MPATALQHFQEDIARARAIVAHAEPLPRTTSAEQLLRSDLLRSAWMFAVGALDAYYCDAYTDVSESSGVKKMPKRSQNVRVLVVGRLQLFCLGGDLRRHHRSAACRTRRVERLNETASRWENTSYSAEPASALLCSCFASALACLNRPSCPARPIYVKANHAPPLRLRSRACTRKAATACNEAIVCVRRPFGYRLLPFAHDTD